MKKFSFFKKACFLCLFLFLASILPLPVSSALGVTTAAKASELTEESTCKAKLNVTKKSLVKGDTYTLKSYNLTEDQKVVFKSGNTDIVSVETAESERDAVLTAQSVGDTTVTVTIKEGLKTVKTLTCSVVVTPPAKTVKFANNTITVKIGDSINLKEALDLKPLYTAEVPVFCVEDAQSVLINSTSTTVKAMETGQALVTATISNGTTDSCTIVVLDKAEMDKLIQGNTIAARMRKK